MTPSTPASASMSAGDPVGTCAAICASTKTLLPVPIRRLIVRLAVLATNTYLPARVIQHEAAWPAATIDVNAPSRNNPSWFECAHVITAVNAPSPNNPSRFECANVITAGPSGYVEKPNGANEPWGADTAVGAAPEIRPRWSVMTSTVPGSGSVLIVTSSCCALTTPTCDVSPAAGLPPPATKSPVVPSSHSTECSRSTNESTVVVPAT